MDDASDDFILVFRTGEWILDLINNVALSVHSRNSNMGPPEIGPEKDVTH